MSLLTNQVRAYDPLRMFGREGHPAPLGAAFGEYGRIDEAMHLRPPRDPDTAEDADDEQP
ncbi:Tn3 family transposase [Streptomyces uncialis]|uniref:Tn3 family transposase n=1 Tax=Streptomyces uncialis TaxID=1048205 RepID=UPI00224F6B8D|nr:Tn3 family transposase [Streptomyces uncialis]MCX4663078.1 transposase [Streptomyces uncialis]